MKYERFSEIWDSIFPPEKPMEWGGSERTMRALIAYGKGDTSEIDRVREFLAS